jgi:serine/threonine protein kinase/tetratricopeptide (TPR) repeat protein
MHDASPEMMSIFFGALERLTAEERAAYLDAACGKHVELRARIEALLRAHEQAGSFLPEKVHAADTQATTDRPGAERPGTTIGPYKLLQQIGEGGMGTVFMAEQTQPVQRKVALKVIKPGMDTREVIARFEAERQALALMDHPHIAKVLDAGTTSGVRSPESEDRSQSGLTSDSSALTPDTGRPYFVMELVKGVPITKYCDEHRLAPKERLKLFVPVCQAVQHAHQKAIIRRDLKPSNVLVAEYDDQPVAKVIDFGVAKATGPKLTARTLFTEFGQVVGTLEYMSPEQAKFNALDIDTRSDIYALDVLLYELLTATTPFDRKRLQQAAFDEILRIIREEEPPCPSTRLSTAEELRSIAANRGVEPRKLSGLVRGELDWIVMKCLDKDRNRRYATANSLAHDLERYLADEPVQACPPSALYRLRKFARRYRTPLLAATGLLLVLVAAVVVSTWQAVRASWAEQQARDAETQIRAEQALTVAAEKQTRTERDHKELALQAEQQARAEAIEQLDEARAVVDKFLWEVSEVTLLREPGLQPLRRELLLQALAYYQRLLQKHGDNPQFQTEAASMYAWVGQIQAILGNRAEALAALEKAQTIAEKLVATQPTDGRRHVLARTYMALGYLFVQTGPLAEAVRYYRLALPLLEALAQTQPTKLPMQRDRGVVHANLGHALAQLGDYDEAVRFTKKALALRMQLAHDYPDDIQLLEDLAISINNLTVGRYYEKRAHDAIEDLENAVRILEPLVAKHHKMPQLRNILAVSWYNLGVNHRYLANFDKALVFLHKARADQVKLAHDNPAVTEYQFNLGRTIFEIGYTLMFAKRRQEALPFLLEALQIQEPLLRDYPEAFEYARDLTLTYSTLGSVVTDLQERMRYYGKAIALGEKLVHGHPANVQLQVELADFHYLIGYYGYEVADEFTTALQHFSKARTLLEKAAATDPKRFGTLPALELVYWRLANIWGVVGESHRKKGQLNEAIGAFVKSGEVSRILVDRYPKEAKYWRILAAGHVDRGVALQRAQKQEEAEAAFREALAVLRQGAMLGHTPVAALADGRSFGPLRSRDDYKKLVAEFDEKKQP